MAEWTGSSILGEVPPRFGILGLVLAGGRSSRMGGKDKALLPLGGVPLVQRAAERLRAQVAHMAVSANGNPDRLAFLRLPIIGDEGESAGPLSGLLAGFRWASERCRTSHVATAACDTPFFPDYLVSRLVAATDGADESIVVARSCDREHPVFGLFPVSLAPSLAGWLAQNRNPSMRGWIASHRSLFVDFDCEPDPFFNINTPDDLETANRLVSTQGSGGTSCVTGAFG